VRTERTDDWARDIKGLARACVRLSPTRLFVLFVCVHTLFIYVNIRRPRHSVLLNERAYTCAEACDTTHARVILAAGAQTQPARASRHSEAPHSSGYNPRVLRLVSLTEKKRALDTDK